MFVPGKRATHCEAASVVCNFCSSTRRHGWYLGNWKVVVGALKGKGNGGKSMQRKRTRTKSSPDVIGAYRLGTVLYQVRALYRGSLRQTLLRLEHLQRNACPLMAPSRGGSSHSLPRQGLLRGNLRSPSVAMVAGACKPHLLQAIIPSHTCYLQCHLTRSILSTLEYCLLVLPGFREFRRWYAADCSSLPVLLRAHSHALGYNSWFALVLHVTRSGVVWYCSILIRIDPLYR